MVEAAPDIEAFPVERQKQCDVREERNEKIGVSKKASSLLTPHFSFLPSGVSAKLPQKSGNRR